MPLDCDPVTVHAGALEAKRRAAAGRCYVDVGFWGGLTRDNAAAVPGLVQAGVLGLKCYLVDPGLPDFPPVSAAGLAQGLRLLAGTGLPLLVHAEDPEVLRRNASAAGRSYAAFVAARPAQAEQVAVGTVVEAVRATGGRAHVVHVSTAAAADLVARAARAGLPVSAETCPHYLALVADQVPDGGTVFAVTPPIRDAGNREQLWQRLRDGSLSMVVSDHSPSGDRSRCEDFDAAAPGVVSLQLALAVTWTAAAARGFGPADLAGWMSAAPSRLAGLAGKGSIAPGKDADFCVFAPDRELLVEPGSLAHRVPATPYDGHRLRGAVLSTWLAGRPVDLTAPPRGRLLRRTAESRAAEREWRS
jgi:allantoinase